MPIQRFSDQWRAVATVSDVVALIVAAIGCGQSPTAPSMASARSAGLPTALTTGSVAAHASRFGARTPGTVFVTSQGLYYDTFVVKDPLPMHGPFQLLT